MREERERLGKRTFARFLRKHMTNAETLLWNALRNRQFRRFKFRRQVPLGRYTIDFLCMANQLAIELDGSIHNQRERKEYDCIRDDCLRERGYRILRFRNNEVEANLPSVLHCIEEAIFTPKQTTHIPLLRNSGIGMEKQQLVTSIARTEKGG